MEELVISKIEWDNTRLKFYMNKKVDNFLVLKNNNNKKIEILKEWIKDNVISIPITYTNSDEMLSVGSWNLYLNNNKCRISIDEAKELENRTKVFFYGKDNYTYIVSFFIDDLFNLNIKVSYMMKNKKNGRRRIMIESNNIVDVTKKIAAFLAKKTIQIYYNIVRTFSKSKKDKILLMSQTRSPISGNLKALDERLKERKLDKKYKIYYSFGKVLQEKISILYWIDLINKIAKSDYIFVDDYAPIFTFLKLKNSKLIQVWHAGVGFKNLGYSRFGKEGSPHPNDSAHRKYDYVTVAAEEHIQIYQEVFGLTKEHFIVTGLPRLDGYLDKEKIAKVKEELYQINNLWKNKKIILFAPTYRGKGQNDAYYDFDKIDFEKLYDLCKEKYIVLFKFHPFIKEKIDIKEKYKKVFFDMSSYKDINELFYITDILITDYSSNIYEYSLFEKPIIYFAYDLEQYTCLRGIHRKKEDFPGELCNNFNEVLEIIKKNNFNLEQIKKFKRENFKYNDSKNCDRVIDTILINQK